ncbi:MAG TPA: CoA pyrophosphatase [Chloroflexota bacterium]|nr:CoA pyrophosphatase [Chloroflexota bacterium]
MSPGELTAFLREQLRERTPSTADAAGLRRAAVLAPLVFKGSAAHVLFTERTHDVATHKGQVSFPGGRIETADASPMDAALRETFEEIGVPPEAVEVLGQLDEVATNAATFAITPFVGIMPDGAAHVASPFEVARIAEVPLEHLLDPAARQPDLVTNHWKYSWDGLVIWGATARMLNELLHILGLVDPFAQDLALLRSLSDAEERARFVELMRELHPARQSAAEAFRGSNQLV